MSEPRRFQHWAYLNHEGMEIWGPVFPNGMVPIVSIVERSGQLGPDGNIEQFYIVYWPGLSSKQREKIIKYLVEKQGGSREEVLEQISDIGLPIRVSLTSGSGTNQLQLFV